MTLKITDPLEQVDGVECSDLKQGYTQDNFIPATEQERRCAQNLIAIMNHMRRAMAHSREGTDFSITPQQYLVLKILKDQERLISELADLFKVSRPTMTRIIDGLEGRKRNSGNGLVGEQPNGKEHRAKLVERVDSPDDRRLVYARITPEGLNMLTHYHSKTEESVTEILRRISSEELRHLEHYLEILRLAFEAAN